MRERLFSLGEWWIDKGEDSPCYYRYTYDKRRRRTVRASLGTADFDEACQRLAEHVVLHGRMRDERPAEVPVGIVLARYYDRHASAQPSADTAKRAIDLWGDFWGDDAVSELTPTRQRAFRQWLEQRGYSVGYVKRVITVGKAALNWAHKEQEIAAVPYVALPSGGDRYTYRSPDAELRRFLAAARTIPHLYTYALIRLGTLCRNDAALDLAPAQVDWGLRTVDLNPAGRQQTKKRRPTVPLPDVLREHLRPLAAADGPFVQWRGRPVRSVKRAFHKAAEAAGCDPRFIPKTLRHTGATELRRRRVPGWEVSGQLGHRVGGTSEIYAIYDPDYHGATRQALDEWVGGLLS
jgi:integrase